METHPDPLQPWTQAVSREGPGPIVPGFSPQPLSVLCLQDSVLGHNSVEDARAAMELYRISRRIREQ